MFLPVAASENGCILSSPNNSWRNEMGERKRRVANGEIASRGPLTPEMRRANLWAKIEPIVMVAQTKAGAAVEHCGLFDGPIIHATLLEKMLRKRGFASARVVTGFAGWCVSDQGIDGLFERRALGEGHAWVEVEGQIIDTFLCHLPEYIEMFDFVGKTETNIVWDIPGCLFLAKDDVVERRRVCDKIGNVYYDANGTDDDEVAEMRSGLACLDDTGFTIEDLDNWSMDQLHLLESRLIFFDEGDEDEDDLEWLESLASEEGDLNAEDNRKAT